MKFPKLENGMISGQLTIEEKRRIANKLSEKGPIKSCEICNAETWTLGDYIISPFPIARHPSHLMAAPADPFHPCALMFCANCGNSKHINLVILGLGDELFPYKTGDTE